jgi:putative phosphoribosyl transferase
VSVACIIVGETLKFADRTSAGHALGRLLSSYRGHNVIIIGLVRGGVVVARTIAKDLALPFDILVVKKIPSPQNSELALGAVAPDGVTYVNTDIVRRLDVSQEYIEGEVERLSGLIQEKSYLYRGKNQPRSIDRKTVLLVDDGIATGATMKAAVRWCRENHAKKIVVAIPVAPPETVSELKKNADCVVVIAQPQYFDAVGQFYEMFEQIEDKKVIELLQGRD